MVLREQGEEEEESSELTTGHNPSSADTILVSQSIQDNIPPPPIIDGYMLMMMEDNQRTLDQSSSNWAAEIKAYLESFCWSRTPSPAVSQGSSLPEIVGINRINDEDGYEDEDRYDGDDEAEDSLWFSEILCALIFIWSDCSDL